MKNQPWTARLGKYGPHPFVKKLHKVRLLRRICRDSIFEGTGIKETSLCRYENGSCRPHIDTLEKWANELGYRIVMEKIDD